MPNRKWAIIIALAAAWLGYAPAAKADPLKMLIPGCGDYHGEELLKKRLCASLKDNVCTVQDSPGGCGKDFDEIYHRILNDHTKVRFEGSARSYAAVLAAALTLYPGLACVGPNVMLGYHQKWTPGPKSKKFGDEFGTYAPNLYPPRFRQWIDAQPGGEPADYKRYLWMPYSVAVGFFDKCPDTNIARN